MSFRHVHRVFEPLFKRVVGRVIGDLFWMGFSHLNKQEECTIREVSGHLVHNRKLRLTWRSGY